MKNLEARLDYWEAVVADVVKHHRHLTKLTNASLAVGCLDSSGPLYNAIYAAFDALLKHFDLDGWISWHVYENDGGSKAMEATASHSCEPRPIRNHRDLAMLIVRSENENN